MGLRSYDHRVSDLWDQIAAAAGVLRGTIPEPDLLGIWLYGSAVSDRLRPDSDIDLLAITRRRLSRDEKHAIVDGLMPISGRITRPAGWRPLDISVVALDDVQPWRYPPRIDLQYGEWRRAEFESGSAFDPADSSDLVIALSSARESSRTIHGSHLHELVDPIPANDLRRAMLDELAGLLDDLADDTRNVILTLARIWVTLETGRVVSKADAATYVIDRVGPHARLPIAKARDLYLAGGDGVWDEADSARTAANTLIEGIREAAHE